MTDKKGQSEVRRMVTPSAEAKLCLSQSIQNKDTLDRRTNIKPRQWPSQRKVLQSTQHLIMTPGRHKIISGLIRSNNMFVHFPK